MSDAGKENTGAGGRKPKVERGSVIERAAEVLTDAGGAVHPNEQPAQQLGRRASTQQSEADAHVEAALASPAEADSGRKGAETAAKRKRKSSGKAKGPVSISESQARKEKILVPGTDETRTVAEFREIKRSVLFSMTSSLESSTKNANLVMVTSARPNEGKTFVSINLAISLASERDFDVLLVDMDQTKQGVCKSLGISKVKGLIDVIENESMTIDDVILETDIDGLSILPSGAFHPLGAELLNSARMKLLLDDLSRRSRDLIVMFDCPPVLATTEASILAQYVGHVLFVVEAGKTSKGNINDALQLISHSQNLGFILNKTRTVVGDTSFGAYSEYGYGYGKPPTEN